ncbi:hypothetical protein [Magnetospira sp. QH-2]|uniref:hypothetical protein n=1 Tax=Magnetospira sp. (strain QH-2) TaxID=1288970 RepID=UPI0003E80AD9|nr:hypothetical protein [Magnetospira sp. QH-2]CCQ72598.1 membrane protein of unknown function [Magnetospira sp. QH-2]
MGEADSPEDPIAAPSLSTLLSSTATLLGHHRQMVKALMVFAIVAGLALTWLLPLLFSGGLLIPAAGDMLYGLGLMLFFHFSLQAFSGKNMPSEWGLGRFLEFLLVTLGVGVIAAFPLQVVLVILQTAPFGVSPVSHWVAVPVAGAMGLLLLARLCLAPVLIARDEPPGALDALYLSWERTRQRGWLLSGCLALALGGPALLFALPHWLWLRPNGLQQPEFLAALLPTLWHVSSLILLAAILTVARHGKT